MKFTDTKWAERLTYLSELEDGWYDNDDGEAISENALATTDRLLRELDTESFVVPGLFPSIDEGYGISIEWIDYGQLGETGGFSQITCHLANDCDNYDIFILERCNINEELSPRNLKDTSLETASFDEAILFLRTTLKRLGFLPI